MGNSTQKSPVLILGKLINDSAPLITPSNSATGKVWRQSFQVSHSFVDILPELSVHTYIAHDFLYRFTITNQGKIKVAFLSSTRTISSMTALPSPSEDQPYCIVSALEAGHLDLPLEIFLDNAVKGSVIRAPSLGFLLRHSKNDRKFVFDLGIRKDFENSPPSVQQWNKTGFHATTLQDAAESLNKGGLSPADIDFVCISHCHFDHTGDTKPFVNSEFIVGAGSASLFKPGYPEDPESPYNSDLLPAGRTRFVDFGEQGPLGPFPHALNFFGDGSLYVVDAAGHLPGHVIVVARTSADGGWVLLGGDSAHHWNLITGESQIATGRPGFPGGCAHLDLKAAQSNIEHIREFLTLPRTRVILAHDEPWYKDHKDSSAFWPGHIESK